MDKVIEIDLSPYKIEPPDWGPVGNAISTGVCVALFALVIYVVLFKNRKG